MLQETDVLALERIMGDAERAAAWEHLSERDRAEWLAVVARVNAIVQKEAQHAMAYASGGAE